MLISVLDSDTQPHEVAMQGQDQINDFSSVLVEASVGANAETQVVAQANEDRAGFLFQNNSPNAMLLLEIENINVTSAFTILPWQYFPPYPGYPIPIGVIAVQGGPNSIVGDAYVYREWQNGPTE